MFEELWNRYKYEKDKRSGEKLIIKCLPLVKSLAQTLSVYSSACCDTEDLVSVGIIGLMDALEKYDPTKQTSFRTYAKYRIRGAMLEEIRNLKWEPRSIQEKVHSLRNTYNSLEQRLSRVPNEDELANAMGMGVEEFRKMMIQIGPSTIFLCSTKTYKDEEDESYMETHFEDPDAISPDNQVIFEEAKYILVNAINNLPEQEALIINLYYFDEMTMKEIGQILSLTESRISQIHSKILFKLFQELNSNMVIQEFAN